MSLRSLLRAVLATLLGCGGGSAVAPDAAVPDAGVAVTFRVHVPASTPPGDAIYAMGSFNDWNPASEAHRLQRVEPLLHEISLPVPTGGHLELKFTRGSLETVERGLRFEEIPNRQFDVLAESTFEVIVGSWADQSPVAGDVSTLTVPGLLGGRRVWVYLPPGYHESTERYPVLYMLDGQNVFDPRTSFAGEWKVDETLEALIPAGEVEPLIVVAIDNVGDLRIHEYTPFYDAAEGRGGGGGEHLDAIIDVLVPHVNATYRTRTDPASTGFGGSSLGGLMTLYAVHARPDVFGVGAAFSPSIWWADREIVDFATRQPKPAARVWMDMGTAEYAAAIADLRRMRDAMVARGFVLGEDLRIVEDPDAGHNEAAWSVRFPDAIRFLFPPR